jgi:hypothetical protein
MHKWGLFFIYLFILHFFHSFMSMILFNYLIEILHNDPNKHVNFKVTQYKSKARKTLDEVRSISKVKSQTQIT